MNSKLNKANKLDQGNSSFFFTLTNMGSGDDEDIYEGEGEREGEW